MSVYKIACVIGGTNTEAALFTGKKITKKMKIDTLPEKGTEPFIKRLVSCIEELKGDRKIKGIGLGAPGFIDRKNGIVKKSKISSSPIKLKEIISKKFKTRVFLENDANCAALGIAEKMKEKNFVLITLGTGIGGALVMDGKLIKGKGNAGEFGHMTVKKNGIKCTCGNRGCFQQYAAKPAFDRLSKKYFKKKMSPFDLGKMAKKGNKKAKSIYQEIGTWLGIGLANVANCLDPEIIFITGNIARSGKLLFTPARNEMKKRIFVNPPKIKTDTKNYELYGAVSLIK